MRGFNFIFLMFVLLYFGACAKKEKPSVNASRRADSLAMVDSLKLAAHGANAPAWFKQMPQREGFHYALGQATSSDRMLAREKAIMNAQVAMAESLKIKADSKPALLRFSHIAKEQALKKGKRWHYFVLLEMPTH